MEIRCAPRGVYKAYGSQKGLCEHERSWEPITNPCYGDSLCFVVKQLKPPRLIRLNTRQAILSRHNIRVISGTGGPLRA